MAFPSEGRAQKCTLQLFPEQRFRDFRKCEEQKTTKVHLLFRDTRRTTYQISIVQDIKIELIIAGGLKSGDVASLLHLKLKLILNELG